MGLPALEFSDCYLDSPQFRERLKSHELELDKTNKFIKELIKDSKALIQALKSLSTAKRKFADSLNDFKFQCIGDAETDDEMCIGECADVKSNTFGNANDVLILPLERFRKEQISAAKDAKKKYDKETEKYCAVLEKHLSLSAKKKEAHLLEADNQVDNVRQHFYEVSLEYVFKVQEVQERKMFDFVEPLLAFLQGLFTYYHHGYELAKDFNHFKTDLTISIQNTRNRFESTRSEVESLMRKMKENPHEHKSVSQHTMEGYLYVQEKRSFVSTWVKYYCTYYRESKKVTMVLFDPKSGGKTGEEESFILKSCTRRKTDSIEKRFCFDVEAVDRPGVITMQALSEEDRRLWMEAMDGREPVGCHGYQFVLIPDLIISVTDDLLSPPSGIDEQGLYRIAGVNSKIQKLLSLAMDPKTCADVELESPEWEIKTITSAIKHYLRMLPAPLMTYQYQRSFIKAAKMDNPEARVTEVHALVHRLPEKNRQMLELLVKHLANVASHHQQNLMTIANLGVVFGPTLLQLLHLSLRPSSSPSPFCLSLSGRPTGSYLGHFSPPLGASSILTSGLPGHTRHRCFCTLCRPLGYGVPCMPCQLTSYTLLLCAGFFTGRKARALYACKAEHDSELSFIAGTIFENVHTSREPGWLEGTLDGRTGLIPENYVEFV
uniref:Rho-type GTPase-activating protein 26 n=1 Tax=Astatotilapia calliptera TaxID=8154 RepID=A0AAX7SE99_ASTCA